MPKKPSTAQASPTTKRLVTTKISDLNQQIEWFYSDDFSLDQAAAKYQAATNLAKDIEKDLNGLKNEIEIISKDFTKD